MVRRFEVANHRGRQFASNNFTASVLYLRVQGDVRESHMKLAYLDDMHQEDEDLESAAFSRRLETAAQDFGYGVRRRSGPAQAGTKPVQPSVLKSLCLLIIMVLAASQWGCSSKPKVVQPQLPITAEPGAPQWSYGSNAISLQLRADKRLNLYDDQAHTLAVCLYQFTDPNTFKDLSKDEAGLVKLLKCEKSGADVASAQRVIMQPGESRDLHLDRAEGAKFFSVVAGYYQLKAEDSALLFEIPIVVFKKGFIFTTKYQVPGQLNVQLNLGPTTMSEVEKK